MANQTAVLDGPLVSVTSGQGGAVYVESQGQPGQKWRLSNFYQGVVPSIQDVGRVVKVTLEEVRGSRGDMIWFVMSVVPQDGQPLSGGGVQQAPGAAQQPQPVSAAPPLATASSAPAASSPPPMATAAQQAPSARSPRPMDQTPGDYGYRDLSIVLESMIKSAVETVGIRSAANESSPGDDAEWVLAVADKYLKWYGERMRDSEWGTLPITREPADAEFAPPEPSS